MLTYQISKFIKTKSTSPTSSSSRWSTHLIKETLRSLWTSSGVTSSIYILFLITTSLWNVTFSFSCSTWSTWHTTPKVLTIIHTKFLSIKTASEVLWHVLEVVIVEHAVEAEWSEELVHNVFATSGLWATCSTGTILWCTSSCTLARGRHPYNIYSSSRCSTTSISTTSSTSTCNNLEKTLLKVL